MAKYRILSNANGIFKIQKLRYFIFFFGWFDIKKFTGNEEGGWITATYNSFDGAKKEMDMIIERDNNRKQVWHVIYYSV